MLISSCAQAKALALALALCRPQVIDGDTISVRGYNIRLNGYNAAEVYPHAHCTRERLIGEAAKLRLQNLVDQGAVVLAAPCAHGALTDRYGRFCGRLILRGVDAAEILISEGLAVASSPDLPQFGDWCNREPK